MKLRIFTFILALGAAVQATAAIYGSDDREEASAVSYVKPLAPSIAVAVPNMNLAQNLDGTFKLTDPVGPVPLASSFLCSDVRFSNQPLAGICTGFLVGDRYLVTAGHCILPNGIIDHQNSPFCQAFSWYFGFGTDSKGNTNISAIPQQQIYRCKNIIRAENIDLSPADLLGTIPGNDFAVIELDRPVTGANPLKMAKLTPQKNDMVYAVGHPFGLPAKFSGKSAVLESLNTYFTVNLDTQDGNSGSPVFNENNEVAGVLFSGHQIDTYDTPAECARMNVCDETGRNCNDNGKFPFLPVSNFIQKIETIQPFIPL